MRKPELGQRQPGVEPESLHTLVPLLQFLLVKMSSLLEIGQLLLRELTLAVILHNQLCVFYFHVFHSTPQGQLPPKFADSICKRNVLYGLVMGVSGIGGMWYVDMVPTRKLERRMGVLKQRNFVRTVVYAARRHDVMVDC